MSDVSCNVSSNLTGLVSCYVTLGTALAPNQANVVDFPLTATAPTAAGPVINYASVAEDGTSDSPTPDASCIGCGSSAAAVVPAPPPRLLHPSLACWRGWRGSWPGLRASCRLTRPCWTRMWQFWWMARPRPLKYKLLEMPQPPGLRATSQRAGKRWTAKWWQWLNHSAAKLARALEMVDNGRPYVCAGGALRTPLLTITSIGGHSHLCVASPFV